MLKLIADLNPIDADCNCWPFRLGNTRVGWESQLLSAFNKFYLENMNK